MHRMGIGVLVLLTVLLPGSSAGNSKSKRIVPDSEVKQMTKSEFAKELSDRSKRFNTLYRTLSTLPIPLQKKALQIPC